MKDRFFVDYLERLENLRGALRAEVADLPPAALDWVPGPEMNSIAVLLAHTAGSLRFWIGDIALEESSGRVREREFQTRGQSAARLLDHLDAAVDFARDNLPRLSLDVLSEERSTGDEIVTRGWALLHALEHAYTHLGHIQLTRQLWQQARQ